MEFKDIRDRELSELKTELAAKRKHLFDLRTQMVTEKLEDPSQLPKTRKDIARIMTAIRRQEIEQEKTKASASAAAKTPAAVAAK